MSPAASENWLITCALVTLGLYGYRHWVNPGPSSKLNNLPLSQFVTAWGFLFMILAVIAEAQPALGAGLALVVTATDLLTNTTSAGGLPSLTNVHTGLAPKAVEVSAQTSNTAPSAPSNR